MPEADSEPSNAELNRLVVALDRAYHHTRLLMWRSFLQGLMSALGATVGLALVVSILAYIFSTLGGIELLRPSLTKLQDMITPVEIRTQSSPQI